MLTLQASYACVTVAPMLRKQDSLPHAASRVEDHMVQRVTRRALFKMKKGKGKLISATEWVLENTRRTYLPRTRDVPVLLDLGAELRRTSVRSWSSEAAAYRSFERYVFDLCSPDPAALDGLHRRSNEIIGAGLGPRYAVRTTTPEGREVFPHLFEERLICKRLEAVLGPRFERTFSDALVAYRVGASPMRALEKARAASRTYRYAAKTDVTSYFKGIDIPLLRDSLATIPWMDPSLVEVVVARAQPLWIRGCGDNATEVTPRHLLPGAPLAPLFANIVLDRILVKPLLREFRDTVVLFVYADDIIVFSDCPIRVMKVLERTGELLRASSDRLTIHPWKTTEPVDVRMEEIVWLGKSLRGRSIRTPYHTLVARAQELARVEGESDLLQRAGALVDNLTSDDLRTYERSVRGVVKDYGDKRVEREVSRLVADRRSGKGGETHGPTYPDAYLPLDEILDPPAGRSNKASHGCNAECARGKEDNAQQTGIEQGSRI